MSTAKVYPLLVAKAERKGRTRAEVDTIITWLTGWDEAAIAQAVASDMPYGDFFRKAPGLNPARKAIRGSICGVKVEEIQDSTMQEIRYLDKLVDELAKGKTMDKILRKV